VYDVVVKKFTFAISSPDEFLVNICCVFAAVLRSLHLIDGLSDNTMNTATDASDVYNVKSDLMRLLANLVYQHPTNQNLVKFVTDASNVCCCCTFLLEIMCETQFICI